MIFVYYRYFLIKVLILLLPIIYHRNFFFFTQLSSQSECLKNYSTLTSIVLIIFSFLLFLSSLYLTPSFGKLQTIERIIRSSLL